jgi:hypothetical protein
MLPNVLLINIDLCENKVTPTAVVIYENVKVKFLVCTTQIITRATVAKTYNSIVL